MREYASPGLVASILIVSVKRSKTLVRAGSSQGIGAGGADGGAGGGGGDEVASMVSSTAIHDLRS
jgi:hypothetical protein